MTDTDRETKSMGRALELAAMPIRAWRVSVKTWAGDHGGIYGARERSIAVSRALHGSQDAGYGLTWNDFRAVRAPEFDALIDKHGMVSWSDVYAAVMLCEAGRAAAAMADPAPSMGGGRERPSPDGSGLRVS